VNLIKKDDMTQQEIQERNKQIALMLGWTLKSYPTYISSPFHSRSVWWSPGTTKTFCCIEGEEFFHSDWTWLHEAAEKVYSLTNPSDSIRHDIIHILGRSHKEAVFIAVSDFAKLYNEKKI
jgi:hypothetical protein